MGGLKLKVIPICGKKGEKHNFYLYPFPTREEECGCLCFLTKKTDQPDGFFYKYLVDSPMFKIICENKKLQKFIKDWGTEFYAVLYEDSAQERERIKNDILNNNHTIEDISHFISSISSGDSL